MLFGGGVGRSGALLALAMGKLWDSLSSRTAWRIQGHVEHRGARWGLPRKHLRSSAQSSPRPGMAAPAPRPALLSPTSLPALGIGACSGRKELLRPLWKQPEVWVPVTSGSASGCVLESAVRSGPEHTGVNVHGTLVHSSSKPEQPERPPGHQGSAPHGEFVQGKLHSSGD